MQILALTDGEQEDLPLKIHHQ